MIERVISGGQTGADLAGWRAAKACGIPTGGWMPKGFLTEDGPRPEFAEMYGAKETRTGSYPERTARNVADSDGTIFFGGTSSGYGATYWACTEQGRPFLWLEGWRDPAHVMRWIVENEIRTLNIAGNRESRRPGIGGRVEAYLVSVFRLLNDAACTQTARSLTEDRGDTA